LISWVGDSPTVTMKKPKASKKSKNGQNDRFTCLRSGLSKPELEHQYKLGLMRDCQIYGKSYKECKEYFKTKGYTLSRTQFVNLRAELKSTKSSENWFSKEALYVLEEDHRLSLDRIRSIESDLAREYSNAQDANLKTKISAELRAIQDTKSKMFSATPLVQELMEVHARQEEEKQAPLIPPNTEKKNKSIPNVRLLLV